MHNCGMMHSRKSAKNNFHHFFRKESNKRTINICNKHDLINYVKSSYSHILRREKKNQGIAYIFRDKLGIIVLEDGDNLFRGDAELLHGMAETVL